MMSIKRIAILSLLMLCTIFNGGKTNAATFNFGPGEHFLGFGAAPYPDDFASVFANLNFNLFMSCPTIDDCLNQAYGAEAYYTITKVNSDGSFASPVGDGAHFCNGIGSSCYKPFGDPLSIPLAGARGLYLIVALALNYPPPDWGTLSADVVVSINLPDHLNVSETPLPGALPLFASGLGVFGYFASRRRKAA